LGVERKAQTAGGPVESADPAERERLDRIRRETGSNDEF
jgi:hypothetical protein